MHLVYRRNGNHFSHHAHATSLLRSIIADGIEGSDNQDRVSVNIRGQAWECSKWELDATCDTFIRKCLPENVAEQYALGSMALVIDLNPNGNTRELFRIVRLWGFTEPSWTPLLLRLEDLGEHPFQNHPGEPVLEFDAVPGAIIHEFLYTQRGRSSGKRSWGRVGSVNGAVLWPHHLDYFNEILRDRPV